MKKYIFVFIFSLAFVFVCSNTNVFASRNDERNSEEHKSTSRPTKTPTPKPAPSKESYDNRLDDRREDDRHDNDHEEECEDSQDPTSTPTPTIIPTSTPVVTSNPTQTPIVTPDPDVCPNLEGIQTSLPDEYHFDTAHYNCLKFELGGPSQSSGIGGASVLGASTKSTGQVLGTSTMAGTGTVEDSIFYSIFSIGSLLTSVGIMKNGKKK